MKRQLNEIIVRAEQFKIAGTIEMLYPVSPPRFVKAWGGEGQAITFGLSLQSVLPYKSGDHLRVTVERLDKVPRISANQALQQIYEVLYVEGDRVNPNKQWDASTIEHVEEVLQKVIPRPLRVRPYRFPKV